MHATMPIQDYPIPERSEENKSDLRVSTENKGINEESKMSESIPPENSEEKNNMLNFIQHLEKMINKNKDLQPNKSDDEDEKIENVERSSLKRVVSGNLLGLNDSRDQSSVSRSSINNTSSRNSLTTQTNENLETKEGWLLKRSYRSPTFIGWQRRY